MAALMHEFIHSVNFNLSKDKSFSRFNVIFREFFSIYFELDFLNFVREKTNYNFALANLYNRYNHIVNDVQEYYCMSWLVNEKMENGVIDKYTNQISETPLEAETFEKVGLDANFLKNMNFAEIYDSIANDIVMDSQKQL